MFGSRGWHNFCEGASEVDDGNAEGGASEGAKGAGEETAVVPAEAPSQTIERVEAFVRWLCQVRRVRSPFSFPLDVAALAFFFSSGYRFVKIEVGS